MTLQKGRIQVLDLWRTLAILGMVLYHFCYDLMVFGVISQPGFFSLPVSLLQQVICWSFILLAGISARFTRSNVRRGLVTLAAGLLIMLGSNLAGLPIRFGILQCLGCSMLLYALMSRKLEKLHPGFGLLWFGLFWLTRWLTGLGYVQAGWLYPLGFIRADFYSADYFGLLPWFFLFLTGTSLGGGISRLQSREVQPAWMGLDLPDALTWPGRHSLLLYLLHQPLLYGLAWLLVGC